MATNDPTAKHPDNLLYAREDKPREQSFVEFTVDEAMKMAAKASRENPDVPSVSRVLFTEIVCLCAKLDLERDYIRRMDAVIDDAGVARSCINPLEDLKRAVAVLKEQAARSSCAGIKDGMTLQQSVYAWLGCWRNKMPIQAVSNLQDTLGPLDSALPECADTINAEDLPETGGIPRAHEDCMVLPEGCMSLHHHGHRCALGECDLKSAAPAAAPAEGPTPRGILDPSVYDESDQHHVCTHDHRFIGTQSDGAESCMVCKVRQLERELAEAKKK